MAALQRLVPWMDAVANTLASEQAKLTDQMVSNAGTVGGSLAGANTK